MAALKALYPSMARPANSYSFYSLTTSDMKLLTRILSHQPSPIHTPNSSTQSKYCELTKKDIEKLPPYLRKESGQEKNLCKMHAGLNSSVIGTIFNWVQKQVDVTLPRCLSEPIDADVASSDEVMAPFLHLMDIKSMWTRSSTNFPARRRSKQEKRWIFQQDRCRACILARLGGEKDIITPLRASVVAKLSTEDKPKSRRLVWFAALMYGCFTDEIFQRMMEKSEFLGRALRSANTKAALKKTKHAEYWNPTAISPEAAYTTDVTKEVWNSDRRSEAEHIPDVIKEVRPFSDKITRVERHTQQEFQAWQAQQQEARRKEKRRSVSPLYNVDIYAPQNLSIPFATPPTAMRNTINTAPLLPFVLMTSLATPSLSFRPRTSYTATPPTVHAPRPRTSRAALPRRAPALIPKNSIATPSPPRPQRRSSHVPSQLPPPVPRTPLATPPLPRAPRNSYNTPPLPLPLRSPFSISSNSPPPPPPKDMDSDLLLHTDSLYNACHPTTSPPPIPPKSPLRYTLLPRLGTLMQDLPGSRYVAPHPQAKRSSSIYSQDSLAVTLQPRAASSIYDTTDAMTDSFQRSANTLQKHTEELNSQNSAGNQEFNRSTHISLPPTPTPDSAEEYRALIEEGENAFLAPSLAPRPVAIKKGRPWFRPQTSLGSVEGSVEPNEDRKRS